MSKGIVLLALGKWNYGALAANCAATIRASNPDIPIHLIYTESAVKCLSKEHWGLFSSNRQLSEDTFYTEAGVKSYLQGKFFIYDASPFTETIYIDADTALFDGGIDAAFEACKETDITFQLRGKYDFETGKATGSYSKWADYNDIRKVYGEYASMPRLSSEFIYFKKCAFAERLFDVADDIFFHPQIPFTKFDGYMPDELAFDIAAMQCGYEHKASKEVFFWWHAADRRRPIEGHIGYSVGGKSEPQFVKDKYNKIIQKACSKVGTKPFRLLSKSTWNKERITL